MAEHKGGFSKKSSSWHFYEQLFKTENRDIIFPIHHESEEIRGETATVNRFFFPLYCLSIDFETATDAYHHYVSGVIGKEWMRICGVPTVLTAIVLKGCSQPRRVFFQNLNNKFGIFETEFVGDQLTSYILTRRGAFMGDPFTKVLLHLIHEIPSQVTKCSARKIKKYFYNAAKKLSPNQGGGFYNKFAAKALQEFKTLETVLGDKIKTTIPFPNGKELDNITLSREKRLWKREEKLCFS
jgi:hypothetical protein